MESEQAIKERAPATNTPKEIEIVKAAEKAGDKTPPLQLEERPSAPPGMLIDEVPAEPAHPLDERNAAERTAILGAIDNPGMELPGGGTVAEFQQAYAEHLDADRISHEEARAEQRRQALAGDDVFANDGARKPAPALGMALLNKGEGTAKQE